MTPPLTQRLYLRIWLAIVAAVVVLTLLFAWLWRLEIEHERGQRPAREITLRNAKGDIIGQAQSRPPTGLGRPGQPLEFEVHTQDGNTLFIQLPRLNRPPPPRAQAWWRPPFDLAWLLTLIALAVAVGTYPVVRRLTQRLEALQQGVKSWGEGDLSHRLPEDGQDEVAYLAQRFNVAAARVQALLASNKALLANASHELRSPLTRIRMGLELMDKTEITRSIHELDALIDEILLASRLDASPIDALSLHPVDLIGLCAEECAQTGAELDVTDGCTAVLVQGESKLLRRVVRNLLENARRYGEGDVSLSVRQHDGQAVIGVSDLGPGVPPDQRERIFEPFYRLPGASERDGGVGLGLALVKSITQRHGGNVRCEDPPSGKGACFTVMLPLSN
jgi:two-component system, OmpR family, sensor kinase